MKTLGDAMNFRKCKKATFVENIGSHKIVSHSFKEFCCVCISSLINELTIYAVTKGRINELQSLPLLRCMEQLMYATSWLTFLKYSLAHLAGQNLGLRESLAKCPLMGCFLYQCAPDDLAIRRQGDDVLTSPCVL